MPHPDETLAFTNAVEELQGALARLNSCIVEVRKANPHVKRAMAEDGVVHHGFGQFWTPVNSPAGGFNVELVYDDDGNYAFRGSSTKENKEDETIDLSLFDRVTYDE